MYSKLIIRVFVQIETIKIIVYAKNSCKGSEVYGDFCTFVIHL